MDLGLEGKVALVTAASKGLGRAVATELAREGARVVISSRDEETLSKTAAEIREETGAEVDYRAANLGNAEDIEALISHAAERFGGVDVLVNNTGGPPAGTFEDFDDEAWQGAFEQILLSLIRCVRGVLPHMRERGGGRIVNIASSSVKQPIENLTLSNTFRAGLAGLAKTLSLEFAPDGILVNTLGPGRISPRARSPWTSRRLKPRVFPWMRCAGSSRRGYPWVATGRRRSSRGWPPSWLPRPTATLRGRRSWWTVAWSGRYDLLGSGDVNHARSVGGETRLSLQTRCWRDLRADERRLPEASVEMSSEDDRIRVCQWGTSDANNYGDRLFPLIAREQLTARLPGLDMTCFAPIGNATLPPGSPPLFPLFQGGESLDRQRREYFARNFDAVIIGGGDVLRFDRSESGYGDPEHEGPLRPYDAFLDFSWAETVPNILWNAPGVPFPFEPARRMLVRLARSHVRYAAVRDEVSRGHLLEAGVEEPVHVYPDSGILLAEIIRRRVSMKKARDLLGKWGAGANGRGLLCFQCSPGFLRRDEELVAKSLARIAARRDLEVVLLPIGPRHGIRTRSG